MHSAYPSLLRGDGTVIAFEQTWTVIDHFVIGFVAALGFGAVVLRGLKLSLEYSSGEEAVFSFAIGFGVLGWLVFPLGISGLLGNWWLLGLLFLGLPGLIFLRVPGLINNRPDFVGWLLITLASHGKQSDAGALCRSTVFKEHCCVLPWLGSRERLNHIYSYLSL